VQFFGDRHEIAELLQVHGGLRWVIDKRCLSYRI